jgi:hypothetical protein
MDLQASLVGQYGGVWTIGSKNQNSDLTTNQRVSKDAEKSQEKPEVGDQGAPIATSGDKAVNPSLGQDQMISHRLTDLARQKQEIEKMKKDQEEHLRWEREEVERVRMKNEEQVEGMRRKMEQMEQKEKQMKEEENKVSKDRAILREERRAAEERMKKERKRFEQEKRREDSITSWTSNRGGGSVEKEFRLMEKRLSRNLLALEDLKEKVEEDPSNLATGSEDLRQLRTNEFSNTLIKLEVDYESDPDYQEDLERIKDLMNDNNSTYKLIKQKLGRAEGSINNATNLRLIGMEVNFTPIDVEVLSSPTFYAFLSDVWSRVDKSPLYRTTMRDNLAAKILQALMRGNESVVTQLRLSTTNHNDWEEIVSYLVAKFGGALRTQELAIQHHETHDRIGFPLESTIIKQQFATIKQHLKATGSVREMIQYHEKHKTPAEAAAFLQQGGYTQRYLTVINEALPLIAQSSNIDKLEGMTHAQGFELLEKQLLDLHKSAQTMSNRYCAQITSQTLLVANPIGRIEKKTEEDNNELKRLLEESNDGRAG